MTADPTVADRVDQHLGRLYTDLGPAQRLQLGQRILAAISVDGAMAIDPSSALPDQDDVMLITYGDSVVDAGQPGLRALADLLDGPLAGVFSTVHVLPFFTSSSDGGFSIVDYRTIADGLGGWADLDRVGGHGSRSERGLMVDLVCNHGSAQSSWFDAFRRDEAPYRDWYVTVAADADTSSVVRPRTHPLLLPVDTPAGERHVWATFSHDQVDFDFANPDVLVEFCSIIGEYIDRGATRIRLDAIAYLWKQLGTSCVHLPQTHEVVKLFRTLTSARTERPLLITETNVPHAQNISYFGDGDEAQVVYNFTLAPLIAWSLLAGDATTMSNWLGRLPAPPAGCSFLNFIASHDGIGLRPIEDLVADDDLQILLDRALAVGGDWSLYSAPGGPRPYELNVSLADLLAGRDGADADRFVVAHALMLAVQGIPAFYVHSMLATPGDVDAVARTGHKRDINRPRLERSAIDAAHGRNWRGAVMSELSHLIRVRRAQPAFAPTAHQTVHVIDPRVVAIERHSESQRVFALHNLAPETVTVELPDWVGTHDLITGAEVDAHAVQLRPWQACWLSSAQAEAPTAP